MKPKDKVSNIRAELKRADRKYFGEPLDERWFVEEYRPGGENNDGYYMPECYIDRSPYFKTRAEALLYKENNIPNKGNSFRIRYQHLYEIKERRWI